MDMKTMVGFAGGFVFAIATAAIALETSDVGRYQISTAAGAHSVYETTFDTATGEVISRHRVHGPKVYEELEVK